MAFRNDDQRLHNFCHEGNFRKVKDLLDDMKRQGIDVPMKLKQKLGVFGYTPLHQAVTDGHANVLQLLIDYGGFVNSKASSGYTPLHLAASGGHVECGRILLHSGADLNAKDEYQKSPLHTAELGARTNVVKVLRSAAIIKAVETNAVDLNDLLSVPRNKLEQDCLPRALKVATEKANAVNVGKIIIKGKDSLDIPGALKYAKELRAHAVRGLLLLVVAATNNNLDLLEALFCKEGCTYTSELIDDADFVHIQRAIRNKEVGTAVPIEIARWRKQQEIREELLMLTDVNQEEETVLWHGLRLTELELSWMKRIKWVKKLMLAKNDFATLPQEIGSYLSNVTKLNLQCNSLREFPRSLLELPYIQDLNLSHNKLQEIPEVHEWSNSLTILDLSHNELTTLPSYCEASNLKKLGLSHNKFRQVPLCICSMISLQFLDLGDNPDILNLPIEMGRLQNLVDLGLENLNDLNDPPRPIRINTKHCITYLNQKLRSTRGYYRMKLMLVGKQERGKTTLVARLQGKNVKESDNKSTVGVEVSEWKYSPRTIGRPFTFNVWDFGGQEEYYATHQCFLTQRSLYLLVWNITHGEEGVKEVKPWLDNIALRAPNSRVIIVATFYDKVSDEDKQPEGRATQLLERVVELANNYTKLSVHKVIVVGLHGKLDNLEHLKKVIYDEAEEYKIGGEKVMGRPIPSSYHELDSKLADIQKEVVEGKRLPIMHTQEFKDVIRKLNLTDITSDDELKTATIFLHEVGSLLHYDDLKNNLDDLYFVDPRWLCDMMSTVVTIEEHNPYVKNGIIQCSSLPLLYRSKQFPTEFLDQYLVLLDRFEIALPLDQEKTAILIPSMLQDVRPSDLDRPPKCYERSIVFDVPTPPGFWSRLIVRAIHSLACIQELIAKNSSQLHALQDQDSTRKPEAPLDSEAQSPSVAESERNLSPQEEPLADSSPAQVQIKISLPVLAQQVTTTSTIQVGGTTLRYWKSGIVYQSPNLFFCAEDLSNLKKGDGVLLCVSKTEQGCKVYGQLIDQVNSLVSDWYHGLLDRSDDQSLQHLITCTTCLEEGAAEPQVFKRSDLVQHISESCANHYCPKGHEVPVVDLVPDVVLADLDRKFFLKDDDVHFSRGEKDQLGEGGFGTVYRGHCKQQSVAVKLFHSNGKGNFLDALRELRVEAKVLQQNYHPCLVNMVGVIIFPKPALVMEEAPMGSLSRPLLKDKAPISRIVLFRIATQIASALDFLHDMKLIYRDLKAANVLLWSLGLDHYINCKLADFGIVATAAPIGIKGARGTMGFIAPEVAYVGANHNRATYDYKADIFSYAMILYQMITREHPFFDVKHIQIASHIEHGRRPRTDYPLVTIGLYTMAQLMKHCWKHNPDHRPEVKTITRQLTSPKVQLMMAVYDVKSEHSLRTACCFVSSPSPSSHPTRTTSSDHIGSELWISCHSERGADVNVYELSNMADLKAHKIAERQVQCMAVCGENIWIASRRGLESGVIDICSAKTRNAIHSIRMIDTSVSCISSNSVTVYIGTMEGYVYKVGVDSINFKEKPKRRYLSEDCINGLAVTNSTLWVSVTNKVLICDLNSMEQMRSVSMPTDLPGYVGQLAVNDNRTLVWSAHIGGRTLCAWDINSHTIKFSISLQEALHEIAPDSADTEKIITAMCPALDTVWCGTGGGRIIIFSSTGYLLLHFRVYQQYVRFLLPINNSGPCNSEECMVLSGGKKYLKIAYLEEVSDDAMDESVASSYSRQSSTTLGKDSTKQPQSKWQQTGLGEGVSQSQSDSAKVSSSQGSLSPPGVAGTVVLWEALRSCYLRQMKIMSSGNTWQSYANVRGQEQQWEDSKAVPSSVGASFAHDPNVVPTDSLQTQQYTDEERNKKDLSLPMRKRVTTVAFEEIVIQLPSSDLQTVKCPKPVLLKKLLSQITFENVVSVENESAISLSYSITGKDPVVICNQEQMTEYMSIKNRPHLHLKIDE